MGWSRATAPAAALLGVVIVVLLGVAVSLDLTDALDRSIIRAVRADALDTVLSPLRWITELGSTRAIIGVAVITLVIGIGVGPWRHGAIGAIVIGLSSLGVELIKRFVARERPDFLEPVLVERGFSFPSGHATLSMVAYGILGVLLSRTPMPRRLRLVLLALLAVIILAVGLSRVWLGVHYPSDVVAGWASGAVVVLVFAWVTRSVSPEPIEAAVDGDPAARRSDPPAHG